MRIKCTFLVATKVKPGAKGRVSGHAFGKLVFERPTGDGTLREAEIEIEPAELTKAKDKQAYYDGLHITYK